MAEKHDAPSAERSAPIAPDQTTVRAFAEANRLKPWQLALLSRLGLDRPMASSDIAAALDKFSKERI